MAEIKMGTSGFVYGMGGVVYLPGRSKKTFCLFMGLFPIVGLDFLYYKILEAGRLETVLFEFSFSFYYIDDNRQYIDKLLKYFNGVLSVEIGRIEPLGQRDVGETFGLRYMDMAAM